MSVEVVAKIRAELDRVGVTYGKAGADYVAVVDDGGGFVSLLGPPRPPRLSWRGPAEDALQRLAALADDAGKEAFWSAFGA